MQIFFKRFIVAAVIAGPALLASQAAAARDRIVVYQDVNYGGSSRVITDDFRNLSGVRFNDIISSVRIRGGTWEFCEHANYRGRCMTLRRNTRNFVPLGYNDIVSSIRKVERNRDRDGWRDGDHHRDGWYDGDRHDRRAHRRHHRRAQITLFRGPHFRGRSVDVNDAVSDLRSLRLQDQVSSIRVDGVWQICSNAKFRGRCRIVDRDISNLSSIGMDDTVSSIRPVDRRRRR